MTDTSKFRPDVAKLFEPGPPLRYGEQIDIPPSKRGNVHITGIADYLNKIEEYKSTAFAEAQKTEEELELIEQVKRKEEKQQLNKQKLDDDYAKWNPLEDQNIKGDPYKTVFATRLDYGLTEIDLQKEFSKYGDVERVRVVRDKITNKSKGYAFVLFERESGARAAYKEANGTIINGRKILTDVERGRTVKTWIPRRLGGGLGGRGYSIKPKLKELPTFSSRLGTPPAGRGGRGGNLRFGSSRGGHGGDRGDRGGRSNGYDSGSRYAPSRNSGRGGYNDRGSGRREDQGYRGGGNIGGDRERDRDYGSHDSKPKYTSRSERPEKARDYTSNDSAEKSDVTGYSSRSRREGRDFQDRERDDNRDSRIQNEREREREKFRERKIETQRERQRY